MYGWVIPAAVTGDRGLRIDTFSLASVCRLLLLGNRVQRALISVTW